MTALLLIAATVTILGSVAIVTAVVTDAVYATWYGTDSIFWGGGDE